MRGGELVGMAMACCHLYVAYRARHAQWLPVSHAIKRRWGRCCVRGRLDYRQLREIRRAQFCDEAPDAPFWPFAQPPGTKLPRGLLISLPPAPRPPWSLERL